MARGRDARRGRIAWGLAVVVSLLLLTSLSAGNPTQRQLAVATEAGPASHAAMSQLRAGGSAVDAAITAALVGGVVNSVSSGIGGGGFSLLWDAQQQRALVLDFRESAPAAIDVAAFERRPFAAADRGRYVGVPGEIAGLYELHQRYGKLPWRDVVRPAAKLAREGFSAGEHLVKVLGFFAEKMKADKHLSAFLMPAGHPPAVGDILKNVALADTLDRIAEEGPRAFYEGTVAQDLVAATRATNGALSLEDLRDYRPVWREPLSVSWGHSAVFTMPPPSAGGIMLLQALKARSAAEWAEFPVDSDAHIHQLAESLRGSISDRMRFLADPSYESIDVGGLVSARRVAAQRSGFDMNRTRPIPAFTQDEHGTHHIVTRDADGNVVSLTTTVNRPFGALVMAPKSGVILNDELNDFTSVSDVKEFGMTTVPNRARPGARPVSSMTPTIVVKNGAVVLALGGSGGTTISTNVTQCVVARLAFGLPAESVVSRPRFTIPTDGATVEVDQSAPDSLIESLKARGETVERQRWNFSGVQLLAVDPATGVSAASDPRKRGVALVE